MGEDEADDGGDGIGSSDDDEADDAHVDFLLGAFDAFRIPLGRDELDAGSDDVEQSKNATGGDEEQEDVADEGREAFGDFAVAGAEIAKGVGDGADITKEHRIEPIAKSVFCLKRGV